MVKNTEKYNPLLMTSPIWCAVIWSLFAKWVSGPFYGEAVNQGAMVLYFLFAISWVFGGIVVCIIVFSISEEISKKQKRPVWAFYIVSLIVPLLVGNI